MTDAPDALTPRDGPAPPTSGAERTEADEARRRDPARLSVRQREVFHLIGLGHRNRDMAEALGVSVKTIETHKENIKAKLQLPSTSLLAAAAAAWLNLPAEDAVMVENKKPHGIHP